MRRVCVNYVSCRIIFYSSMRSLIFFFFSSRRRHTRCYRDWSSDVCSSDLDSWPAIGSQLMFGVGIGLVTVALLGDRILGYDRYQWQGNLIALATVIAIQPWLIKNFWASAAIGVLGVAGMMFADARQSLAAFLLVLFVTAFYWAAAKYLELNPATPNRLRKAITGRYIALPLALVLVTVGAIAFTYNPNKLCHCVTDRIIALQSGPGDRDTLLLRGLTMVEQNPIL